MAKRKSTSPKPKSKREKEQDKKEPKSAKKGKESEKKDPKSAKKGKHSDKKDSKSADASSKVAEERANRFPVQMIHNMLVEKFPNGTVKKEAAFFLTAVLEYLAVEILEMSANVSRNRTNGKAGPVKVTLGDNLEAIETDTEMKELIVKVKKINSGEK